MKLKRKKLEIKNCWSTDIDNDNPWCWEPLDNDVFYLLEMCIGLTTDEYFEFYSVIIATPEGILSQRKSGGVINQLIKIIILDEYNWKNVLLILDSILSSIDVIICRDVFIELERYFYHN